MQPVGKRSRSKGRKPRVATIMRTVARHNRAVAVPVQLFRAGGRMPGGTVGEKKNIDTTPATPAFGTATASLTLLNGVAQGSSAVTRLGRQIVMKSLYIRGWIQMAPTSTGGSPVRLLVVYDKQANAAAPVATDVLAADVIAAQNNLNNSRRFVTLIDHVIPFIGTAGPQGQPFSLYKKLNMVTEFNAGNAGTVGDIQTGSVYCLIWTNANLLTASALSDVRSRIRFTDN